MRDLKLLNTVQVNLPACFAVLADDQLWQATSSGGVIISPAQNLSFVSVASRCRRSSSSTSSVSLGMLSILSVTGSISAMLLS